MEIEPWMRGTHLELDAVRRAAVHSLELAQEDISRWCADLSDTEMFARPGGVASVAFHLRHIARSLDRLLTYANGSPLNEDQLDALHTEMAPGRSEDVVAEFQRGIESAKQRVRSFKPETYEKPRGVGRQMLPTTVGGLLLHCMEHTSRHVGQAVTTAQVVRGGCAG